MVHFLRNCAGRVSVGAWRSRKFLIWGVCSMTLMFLVYVQYSPNSITGVGSETQQHRSLHSYQRQASQQQQQEEDTQRNAQRVRFIDNDYVVKSNERESERDPKRDLEPPERPMIPFEEERGEKPLQEVDNRFGPVRENLNTRKMAPPRPVVPMVETSRRADSMVGNAAAAWSGGSFQFNAFGEPVYNHDNRPNYIPKERVIHLDLKGAPPLPSVYKTFIPWLASIGATSILLEYEDMFPWEGVLSATTAKNHYTKKDIKDILAICKSNNIQVIPLVQTFGHLEFALKLSKYSYLREVPELPQALCPSQNDSMWLVKNIIDQVMELHRGAKYLHIGCDEVFQMGECDKCRMKPRDNLFLEHVSQIAKYVRASHGAIPLIWHDMLTHVSESSMKDYNFGELVEPMVWVYAEDVYRFVQPSVWTKFSRVFPSVWAASAFKGAFGEQSTVPNVRRHLDNNLNWLDVMSSEEPKFSGGFRGLVITGWQRHDHFAVLCELLPSAMPSLAINLISTTHGFFNDTVLPRLYDALRCMQNSKYEAGLNLDSDPFLWDKFSWCYFPGAMAFKTTARLDAARRDVRAYIDRVTLKRGWVSDYNRRHNFSSPMRVDEDMEELPSRLQSLKLLVKSAKEALLEWFDVWTAGEWVEQHIWPLLHELQTLQTESESMKLVQTWPVRPLPLLPQLQAYGFKDSPRKTKEGDLPRNGGIRQNPAFNDQRIKYY